MSLLRAFAFALPFLLHSKIGTFGELYSRIQYFDMIVYGPTFYPSTFIDFAPLERAVIPVLATSFNPKGLVKLMNASILSEVPVISIINDSEETSTTRALKMSA